MPITCDRLAAKVSPKVSIKANSSATYLKLGNGVTLVHQEMPTASVASVDIWVKAGASNDPDQVLGMAHFLEHMIFKGTEAIAAGEFDLVIESEGGVSNAATSLDYAHYSFTVAASRFAITLPYLAQMLLKARIDEEDLEQERLVVLEELRQAMDDPDWCAYQHLMETAYDLYPSSHPYVRSVLGNEATINEITAAQMREYHRLHYRPENMTVAIAGAVTREEAIMVVNAAFNNDAFAKNNFANKNIEPKTVAIKPDYRKNRRSMISLPNLQLVKDRIMKQVIDLINHQVSEVELNKAKRSLCNHFTFALESPSQLANFLGYHSLLGCEDLCRDWSTAYSDIIKKVEPKDLQFLAKKYLNPDKCIVTAVLKK